MIGASASVSGTMAAAIRFAFVQGSFLRSAGAMPMPRRRCRRCRCRARCATRACSDFSAVWFGVNIIFGIGSIAIGADGASVAWQAHIGGFLAGLMLFSLFDPVPRALPHAADASSPDQIRAASDRRLRRRAISSIIQRML